MTQIPNLGIAKAYRKIGSGGCSPVLQCSKIVSPSRFLFFVIPTCSKRKQIYTLVNVFLFKYIIERQESLKEVKRENQTHLNRLQEKMQTKENHHEKGKRLVINIQNRNEVRQKINFKIYLGDLSLIVPPFYNYYPKDELHTFLSIYAYIFTISISEYKLN